MIMKDKVTVGEPFNAAMQPNWSTPRSPQSVNYCKSKGCNNFARDGVHKHHMTHLRCYRCNKIGHLIKDCPKSVNTALPTVTIYVDRAPISIFHHESKVLLFFGRSRM